MCIFKRLKKKKEKRIENLKQEDEMQVDLLKKIVELAKNEKEIWISTVQRKCGVGYDKALKHIEYLVQNNILTRIEGDTTKYTINEEQYNKFKETKIK